MVYELQREGRTFYSNSSSVVSVLVQMGWTVSVGLGSAGRADRPVASRPRPATGSAAERPAPDAAPRA